MMHSCKEEFQAFIHALQNEICDGLLAADGSAILSEDKWERPGGGGGITRVISKGSIFEKGGVNTSVVYGELPISAQKLLKVSHGNFFACGLSLVMHPRNPYAPTVHMNVRYFELYDEQKQLVDAWFGGGSDLTPYYLFKEDARHFHQVLERTCHPLGKSYYPAYKEVCDEYFFNHHRGEGRGIGGIFFEYCRADDQHTLHTWFEFAQRVGRSFLPSYLPIIEKRASLPFGEHEEYWQEIRRGRYVEFNLLHDRGTLFGIKTKGRTESILMSLPPRVRWDYQYEPEANSKEEELLAVLKKTQDWTEVRK